MFVGVELGPGPTASPTTSTTPYAAAGLAIRANVPGRCLGPGLRARKRLERYFFDLLPERQRGSGSDLFSVLATQQTEDGLRFADRDVVNT